MIGPLSSFYRTQDPGQQLVQHAARGRRDEVRRLLRTMGLVDENEKMKETVGVRVPHPTRSLNVALSAAAQAGHAQMVTLLIQAGADVAFEQHRALIQAARGGHAYVVKVLLDPEARQKARPSFGVNPALGGLTILPLDVRVQAVVEACANHHWRLLAKLCDHVLPTSWPDRAPAATNKDEPGPDESPEAGRRRWAQALQRSGVLLDTLRRREQIAQALVSTGNPHPLQGHDRLDDTIGVLMRLGAYDPHGNDEVVRCVARLGHKAWIDVMLGQGMGLSHGEVALTLAAERGFTPIVDTLRAKMPAWQQEALHVTLNAESAEQERTTRERRRL